ncbi:hypothetical protein AVEN_366-1 [Araneus ventricosus]|uniref:Uncharacterized protein n=1 Tax=Araneus ventricosus TaxID=182803 RepID=A0A4Y2DRS9_ARAVE|nr:hypothetical protein AVEN_366-1 [Araneus ventricosus]
MSHPPPVLPRHAEFLNSRRCDSSQGRSPSSHHRPRLNPSLRRYAPSSEWRQQSPTRSLYPQGRRDPAYLSGGFSSICSWCPRGSLHIYNQNKLNYPVLP